MAETREQDERIDMDEVHDDVAFGNASPSNSYDHEEDEDERPQFASRSAGGQDQDELDDDEKPVDRAGPSLSEVQSLGPIEELDAEMFDKVVREVPAGSRTTKEVLRCKFCAGEFTYMMRELHIHKNVCPKYPGRESMVREVRSVPDDDNPEVEVDVETVGEDVNANAEDDVNGPEAPVINDDDDDADMGLDLEDEETQMLDDEPPAVLVPDRIEMPNDSDEARPTLKVTKPRTIEAVDSSGDVEMVEEHADLDTDEKTTPPRGRHEGEAVVERGSPENVSETASTGSAHGGRDAYRLSFRMFCDASGDHAECRQCKKTLAPRASGMSAHYNICSKQSHPLQDRPTTRDEKNALLQLITPKKKSTKRRMSTQDADQLDEEGASQANESETESQPGSPPLRRSKRFKSDNKGDAKVSKPANDMEPLELTSSTALTEGAASKSTKSSDQRDVVVIADDYPLSEFDLVASDKRLKCKHCQGEVSFREDVAEKHLYECSAYRASRTPTTSTALSKNQKRGKTTEREGSSVTAVLRHPERLGTAEIMQLDHETALAWIFGSVVIEDMRSRYGKASMAVRSPVARFRAVETALCQLDVAKVLVQLAPTVTVMVPRSKHNTGDYNMVPCNSPSVAFNLYESEAPIVFRAPEIIAQMFVPPLAKELGCSDLITTGMQKAEVFCGRGRVRLDWQYHKADFFVVCLRGKALWKVYATGVKAPPSCFHPSTTDPAVRESVVAMQVASLGVGSGHTGVQVPSGTAFDFSQEDDGDDDMEGHSSATSDPPHDASSAGQQMVVDAGAVAYIPAGTWYSVDGLEGDSIWLQFELKKVAIGDIVTETVNQLVVSQFELREPVQETPDSDAFAVQQRVIARLRGLGSQLMTLSPNEVFPELLLTKASTPVAVMGDVGDIRATKLFNFDLTDPNTFQGGHQVDFFKRSSFRVNPLAVLMRGEELPPLLVNTPSTVPMEGSNTTGASRPTGATSKKALNRKTKRGLGLASPPAHSTHATLSGGGNNVEGAQKTEGVYLLQFGLGGIGERPRLKVQFRCSPNQQVLVDWMRTRETKDPFRLSELAKVLGHHQRAKPDMEMLKNTLRFLCMAGYLTNVDVPV